MRSLYRCFTRALFGAIFVSLTASSQSDADLFLPADDLSSGDSQFISSTSLGDDLGFLPSEDPSSDQSFNAGFDSSISSSQDLDTALFLDDNPASLAFSSDDVSRLPMDDGSASTVDGLPLPLFSDESGALASDEFFDTTDFDPETLSEADCDLPSEPLAGKLRRGDFCIKRTRETTWPPAYALDERYNYLPENDPKRRPSNQQKNSRADFTYCPSGPGGYRMYWVCDNGNPKDRISSPDRDTTLINLSLERACKCLPLLRSTALTANNPPSVQLPSVTNQGCLGAARDFT